MSMTGLRCGLCAVTAWAAFVAPAVCSTRLRDLTILPASQQIPMRTHGYIEHRVRVRNESASRRHEVRLIAPAQSYHGAGDTLAQVERTVTLAPGATAVVSLPAPPYPMSGSAQVRVVVDGEDWGVAPLPSLSSSHYGHAGYNKKVSILTTRAIDAQAFDDALWTRLFETGATNAAARAGMSRHDKEYSIVRSEYELAEWSDNWLAYTCHDGIVLAAADLAGLPEGVAECLHRYVGAGGLLVIAGTDAWPFAWAARADPVRPWVGPVQPWARLHHVGFGLVALVPDASPAALDDAGLRGLLALAQETLQPWTHNTDMSNALRQFPVVDGMNLPVRGMYFIMLVFAIVIGPVLLVLLGRLNRRIWLLWIVPLVAGLTCLCVAAYALLSEGITPTARMHGVTLLDQRTHEATTLGLVAVYCPLTPSGGLHFDAWTELSAFVKQYRYDTGSAKYMDWTRDQHLTRGWVSARIPAYFQVRRPALRRERLDIVWDAAGPRVSNGLGADIERLWVRGPDGRWYRHEDGLAAGDGAVLVADDGPPTARSDPARLRELYRSTTWASDFEGLATRRHELLDPGMYLAVLKGAPFLEHGLDGRVKLNARSTVVGRLADAPGRETR